MKIYWQQRRAGQRLILFTDDETEIEVGAVRQTPRGFDALAKTNTYDPGRARKGFATIEDAKSFVESFHPWGHLRRRLGPGGGAGSERRFCRGFRPGVGRVGQSCS